MWELMPFHSNVPVLGQLWLRGQKVADAIQAGIFATHPTL